MLRQLHMPKDHLPQLLQRLQEPQNLAERHLWLHEVWHWISGREQQVHASLQRLGRLTLAISNDPKLLQAWRYWWHSFVTSTDATALLADLGLASRQAFWSELIRRLHGQFFPATPDTRQLDALFDFLRPSPHDSRWLTQIPADTQKRLKHLLEPPLNLEPAPATLDSLLLDGLTYCISQINAAGFATEVRSRMSEDAQSRRSFHELNPVLQQLHTAIAEHGVDSAASALAADSLRQQLDACRNAAYTVYAHLQENGISVGIVFQLRQMRKRVIRSKQLIDVLMSAERVPAMLELLAQVVQQSHEALSVRHLWRANSHMLAEKMVERSAESGEHYITRNLREYLGMLGAATGGGAILGLATWSKFGLHELDLSSFWLGLSTGLNYALWFVIIMALHWTVATKQPAVTAPAMAHKLKHIEERGGVQGFVNEISHLIRSQAAAISGNVLAVIPVVALLSALLGAFGTPAMVSTETAWHVLHDLHLLGPTAFFAAFTGVLLFISSMIAGWVENAFVLNKLHSAIRYHPRLRHLLGADRAERLGDYLMTHVSSLAANISLGLLLGLTPAFMDFFGVGMQVRHVTLSAGQLTAAAWTLGWPVFQSADFWWALAGLLIIGPLNLSVSFYLAFRIALTAQSIGTEDRSRIRKALWSRMRQQPLSFIWPQRTERP
jgi:site-specific recombinase